MKKIITYLCIAFVALTGLSSCQDYKVEYDPAANPPAVTMYQAAISAELTPAYNGVLKVLLSRTDASAAESVNISFISSSTYTASIFTLETPVATFQVGEFQTAVNVTFNLNNLATNNTQYKFSLKIADANQAISKGGYAQTDITAIRKLTYVPVETPATFTSTAFGGNFTFTLYRAVEAPTMYRMAGFFVNTISFTTDPGTGKAVIPAQDLGEDLFVAGTTSWIRGNGTYSNGVCSFGDGTPNNAYFTNSAMTSGMLMTSEVIRLPAGAY